MSALRKIVLRVVAVEVRFHLIHRANFVVEQKRINNKSNSFTASTFARTLARSPSLAICAKNHSLQMVRCESIVACIPAKSRMRANRYESIPLNQQYSNVQPINTRFRFIHSATNAFRQKKHSIATTKSTLASGRTFVKYARRASSRPHNCDRTCSITRVKMVSAAISATCRSIENPVWSNTSN